jgi:hypothetical protein
LTCLGSDSLMVAGDCDTILNRLHDHARRFWRTRGLGDYQDSRRKIGGTLDELRQRCRRDGRNQTSMGRLENVTEQYEMGSYLRKIRANAEDANLDSESSRSRR